MLNILMRKSPVATAPSRLPTSSRAGDSTKQEASAAAELALKARALLSQVEGRLEPSP
jgi:hypothetical protein